MEREQGKRRPRISEGKVTGRDGNTENFEKVNYNRNEGNQRILRSNRPEGSNEGGDRPYKRFDNQERTYNRNSYSGERNERPYQRREGGYQQREGGYQQREGGYQPRQGGYQQREGGYQPRQGGYQQREGGYQQREGGYQRREGGFQPRQGGYQQREGGFQRREGGYQQREGGYQRREGGYQQRDGGYQQRQGGYNNRPGGGYQRREGGFQQREGGYNPNAKYSQKKQLEYKDLLTDPNEPIRLNKYLANAGVCSRREADEFITNGAVKVNGEVVTELGTKIHRNDTVTFNDQPVSLEKKVYVLLNKPKDCVTTSDDPQGRLTVMDIVRSAATERIYPVGRLDRNTTGVLLLTNDGDLASKLTHPKFVKKKIYHVWLDKDITEEDLAKIAEGVELEDGEIHADAISYANEEDRNQVGIEIHSGRNRIVRRIFEHLGYRVTKLDRVYFAGLTKKNLPRGRWRYLTQQEVNMLRMGAFE
ncbi:MAG: pseudouridine synthase [Bacteroidales bacterium]